MDAASLLADPDWLPHRYDAGRRRVEFVRLTRSERRVLPFLRESFLAKAGARCTMPLEEISRFAPAEGSGPHFIFHSAFCCSTLLARALDAEGKAESLREPQILSDLARTGPQDALPIVLTLLARSKRAGEAVLIKPSNLANRLIEPLLALRPRARAILLHAALPDFLVAVARGGTRRRQWARTLAASYSERPEAPLNPPRSDLEAAASAWMNQHAQFARLTRHHPASRIASLEGRRLLTDTVPILAAAARHFGLSFAQAELRAIAAGPIFSEHAKQPGRAFDAAALARENAAVRATHSDEIDGALGWAEEAAAQAGLPMTLGSPLLNEAAVVGPEGFEPPT